MKETILDIVKKVYHNHLTPETATVLLFDLFTDRQKYKIKICHLSEVDIEEGMVDKMQDDGWEICGTIVVSQEKVWCRDKSITIPMRKKQ